MTFSFLFPIVVLLNAHYEGTKLLPVNLPVYIYMTNLFGDDKLNRIELIFHVYSIQFKFTDHLYRPPLSKVHYGGLCTAFAKLKTG